MAGCLLTGVAALAQAQYVWINEKGIKQLSDRPPPPSVPLSHILKAPGRPAPDAPLAPLAPDPAGGLPAATNASSTTAERNADFQKRQAAAAERAQQAADEAGRKADQAANCDNARQNQRLLDSGQRIAGIDRNGERSYISDEERARQEKRTQRALAGCK